MYQNATHHTFVTSSHVAKIAILLTVAGLLVSCGDKKASEAKVGQSIVRVNNDEITIHQLNAELQRTNIQPAQQEAAGKQLTKALVDRQILVQAALDEKLDRNPKVMQAIEGAKAQILAQAYLEGKVASVAAPTATEVNEYRVQHPEIFANRKIYVMDEISFVLNESIKPELEKLSNSAKTLDEVTIWLDAKQIKHGRTQAAHAAESVPADLLNKFSKMVIGDLIFINANGRALVGKMVEVKNVPISEADAKPLVERILIGQKRKQAAETELARLRGVAKIEYLNSKFDPATDAAPAVAQAPAAESKATSQENGDPKNLDKSIEKGLSGL
jgi:EpsD family peptidyl-prolyl cis-trans isomerase